MDLGKSIRSGTSWIFSGQIVGRGLELTFGIILARILIPSDFGILITVQIFTGMAGFIAGGGMGQALIQAKQVEKSHYHVVFTLQLFICTCIYWFFYTLAPYFANWFNTPIYADLLRVSALTFLFRPFNNIASAKLRREMRFKAITITGICSALIVGSTSIMLALNNYGTWSLVLGGLAGLSFRTPLLIFIAKTYPVIKYDTPIAKKLGSYGIKFSINDIIFYIKSQVPNFILGKFLGPTTVGLFNKGSSLSDLPVTTISGSAYQTIFRALSSTQENLDQSKYIYLRTITLVSVYTFPFYIGLFWLSEAFIVTVYGEKWLLAAIPLQILSIAGLFNCISNPSGAVMAAQNLLGTEIKIQFTGLILTVAGCLYGVLQDDLALISFGLLPSAFFILITISYYALRQLNSTYKDLFLALKPALKLNIFLILILAIADIEIQIYLPNLNTTEYLITLSSLGCISYVILFLFYPISALEKETQRWKRLFRLIS